MSPCRVSACFAFETKTCRYPTEDAWAISYSAPLVRLVSNQVWFDPENETKRRNVRPRRTLDPIGISVWRHERGWAENDRCVALFGRPGGSGAFLETSSFGEARHRLPAAANPLAERQGFEPWVPVKAQRFSRPPRSTAPAPLHRQRRIT